MQINPYLLSSGNFPYAELFKKKKELTQAGLKVFEFDIGDPKDATPQFIIDALKEGISSVSQYPTASGENYLREAIASYLKRRFGASLELTEITPSLGSKEAIYSSTVLFQGNPAKNIVIAPEPGYFVMKKSTELHGLKYYGYDVNHENSYIMDLETVDPDILKKTAVVWLIYPHNPTGASVDLEYLKKQLAICKKYDICLCADETYVDFYFTKEQPSILQITKENVLAFHSCSKRSGMTGYRSGFVAGDQRLISTFTNFRNINGAAMASFIQYASAKAWSDDQHVIERRKIFTEKKKLIIEILKEKKLEYLDPDATFYIWVKAPNNMIAKDYAKILLENQIAVCPGDFFGEENSKFFRIALAPTLEDIKLSVDYWLKSL